MKRLPKCVLLFALSTALLAAILAGHARGGQPVTLRDEKGGDDAPPEEVSAEAAKIARAVERGTAWTGWARTSPSPTTPRAGSGLSTISTP